MFKDLELNNEQLREFAAYGVVIAHNSEELLRKANHSPICGDGVYLDTLVEIWRGRRKPWTILKGAKVLDIGAGINPSFSYLCAVNGADVTAIDLFDYQGLDIKLFTPVKAEMVSLVMGNKFLSHPQINDRRFDLIHSRNFVGISWASELPKYLNKLKVSLEGFEEKLSNHCDDLLAEGGVSYLDRWHQLSPRISYIYHKKVGGKIVQFNR